MNSQALIDVALPVFNAAPYLQETLDSISEQSHQNFRCFVVDDGSSDQSWRILQGHARRDTRFHVLTREHRGLVATANQVFAMTEADYITRIDADDRMPLHRLASQLALLEAEPSVDVVSGLVRGFPEAAVTENMQYYLDWLNSTQSHDDIVREIFVESPIANPSVMLRRSAMQRLGAFRAFAGPEDYEYWLRAWELGLRFAKIAEPVLDWRQHPNRVTFTDARYDSEAFRRVKLEVLARTRLKSVTRIGIAGAGRDGKLLGRGLTDLGLKPGFWLDLNPRKIGQKIQGARVFHYDDLAAWFEPENRSKTHILCCVGVKGARAIIREALTKLGLTESEDFTCVA